MKKAIPIAVLLGLGAVAPTLAQTVYSQPGNAIKSYDRLELQQIYFHRLNSLRAEALDRQAHDGGTLSPASRAYLQVKLDKINATRERDARRNDLMSVDAFSVERRGND
ncbi:hypothetical protein [uncultured Sphingomonas sp.]|uniref:hypothetical protein n=1 Tax=unclassified Sphingomonas TaxID=196159 RepID=UPI0025FD91FD|nr:hypothetical protein [uncultured Sphingomonas sp.]